MSSRVSVPLVVLWPPETFAQLTFSVAMFFSFRNAYLVASCMHVSIYFVHILIRRHVCYNYKNITVKDHHHSFTDTPTLLSRLSAVLNENSIHENTTCIEFSTYKEINYFADVSIVLTMYNKPFSCILHDLYFFEKLNIDAPVILLLKNYNLKSHV